MMGYDYDIHEVERRCGCLESDVEHLITLAGLQSQKIKTLEKQVAALLECFPDLDVEVDDE